MNSFVLETLSAEAQSLSKGELQALKQDSWVQIVVVERGVCEVQLVGEKRTVPQGEAILIQADVAHSVHTIEGFAGYLIRFAPDVLASGSLTLASEMATWRTDSSGVCVFALGTPWSTEALNHLRRIRTLEESKKVESDIYELKIRLELSAIRILMHENVTLSEAPSIPRKEKSIRACLDYIDTHYAEDITLEAIAAQANMSTTTCTRLFKRELGCTPHHYLVDVRIARAAELLSMSADSISHTARAVGFNHMSHFTNSFRNRLGCTPRQYRAKF